jgi:hypothetical protein
LKAQLDSQQDLQTQLALRRLNAQQRASEYALSELGIEDPFVFVDAAPKD